MITRRIFAVIAATSTFSPPGVTRVTATVHFIGPRLQPN
jgi:hypothetical protein